MSTNIYVELKPSFDKENCAKGNKGQRKAERLAWHVRPQWLGDESDSAVSSVRRGETTERLAWEERHQWLGDERDSAVSYIERVRETIPRCS